MRLYEKLKDDKRFKDKLKWDEINNCLTIVLHEYLSIQYFEGNYTACYDEGYLQYVRTEGDALYHRPLPLAMHCHCQDDNQALKDIIYFATGDEIFIEDVRWFSLSPLKIMTKEKFEKQNSKYMKKDHLRIYSKHSIVKRNV